MCFAFKLNGFYLVFYIVQFLQFSKSSSNTIQELRTKFIFIFLNQIFHANYVYFSIFHDTFFIIYTMKKIFLIYIEYSQIWDWFYCICISERFSWSIFYQFLLFYKTKCFANSWSILLTKTLIQSLSPAEVKQQLSTGNNCRNVFPIGLKSSICLSITTKL